MSYLKTFIIGFTLAIAAAPAAISVEPADLLVMEEVISPELTSTEFGLTPLEPIDAIAQSAIELEPVSVAQGDRQNPSLEAESAPVPDELLNSEPSPLTPAEQLDLDPEVVEDSPLLQRWLEEVPDVLSEIRHDPSFRTRVRVGYSQFPGIDDSEGFTVGVEDVFVGRTGLTVSGEYQGTFEGDRSAYGADLRYYALPLGSYVNVAPVIGYRYLDIDEDTTEGLNLGLRVLLSLSRTGAADVSLTQSWVAPGTDQEVGLTTLSFGYALTRNLRLSTDLQRQNSPQSKDSRVGIILEWML